MEVVIKRLVNRTAIEIEGWKRIPAVRRLFKKALLQVDRKIIAFDLFECMRARHITHMYVICKLFGVSKNGSLKLNACNKVILIIIYVGTYGRY